jgi:hypothetical protein
MTFFCKLWHDQVISILPPSCTFLPEFVQLLYPSSCVIHTHMHTESRSGMNVARQVDTQSTSLFRILRQLFKLWLPLSSTNVPYDLIGMFKSLTVTFWWIIILSVAKERSWCKQRGREITFCTPHDWRKTGARMSVWCAFTRNSTIV